MWATFTQKTFAPPLTIPESSRTVELAHDTTRRKVVTPGEIVRFLRQERGLLRNSLGETPRCFLNRRANASGRLNPTA